MVPSGAVGPGVVTAPGGPRRVRAYEHLAGADLLPPDRPGVFFDPVDTEAGIWATADLLAAGCTVLDLGCGSGASARALVRAGAGHVHGVDISPQSVAWATQRSAGAGGTTFAVADYGSSSPAQLVAGCPFDGPPDVVTSNPPYVPLAPRPAPARVSIDGGPDGLAPARIVIRHAARMAADLAITLGSYSCPRIAAQLLAADGYAISAVTLSALRLGQHTVHNAARVLELEASGEGPLLRTADGVVHYVVMALSCRRAGAGATGPAPAELLELMRRACRSPSVALDALDAPWSVPVRVLVLPDEPRRHHA